MKRSSRGTARIGRSGINKADDRHRRRSAARAASGHAAALPSSVMNCRRFIRSPRRRARPVWVECCKGNNLVASTIEKQIAPNEKHPCLLSDCGFKGHN
jgi:hypothetical protein